MIRFVLLLLFCALPLFSTFVGNTAEPSILMRGIISPDSQIFRLKIDGVYDRIARRALKRKKQIFPMQATSGFGGVVLNIWERFDGYLYTGYSRVKIKDQMEKNGFSWQAGGKVVLVQIKDSSLGFDVKYWMVRPFDIDRLYSWQVAGGLTQQIGFFFPYLGFVVSRIRTRVDGRKLRDNHSSSLLFGASFSNGKYFLCNFEGRVIHEKAFSANLAFMF